MPKKEKSYQKFPPKQIITQTGAIIDFNKINDDFTSGLYVYVAGNYQELFPSVYSIEIPNEGFTKLYDFFVEEYFENRGLITYDQYSLYNYLATLRNRGYYLSINGKKNKDGDVKGLAQMVGMKDTTVYAHLDHLEDCLLIHRVRRLDLRGMPSEIIIHSPFTKHQLDNQGKQKIILERISKKHTQKQREKSMVSGISETGKIFNYLDRKSTPDCFQFNYKAIKETFGDHARKFTDYALHFFKANLFLLTDDKSQFEKSYRTGLNRQMSDWGIGSNAARERCYIAANNFRRIYSPTEMEICEA